MQIKRTGTVTAVIKEREYWCVKTQINTMHTYTYTGFKTEPKVNGNYIKVGQMVYAGDELE